MKVYYTVDHFDRDHHEWIEGIIMSDFPSKWPLYSFKFIKSKDHRVEIEKRNNIICDSKVRLDRMNSNRLLKKSLRNKH